MKKMHPKTYLASKFKTVMLSHVILTVLLLINFVIHIPFLSQPVVDTEADHYYTAIAIGDNHFNFFTPSEEEKVPVMFIVPSILLKILPNIIWGRLESLMAATVALIYVYLIGAFFHSPYVGLLATILCIFFPMFAVQTVFYTDAMMVTAVFLPVLYYFLIRRKRGYLISASLAVLTKETMVFMPVLLFILIIVCGFLKPRVTFKKYISEHIYLLFPLCAFFLWTLLNKLFFGYFFFPGNTINIITGISTIQQIFFNVTRNTKQFIQQANGSALYIVSAVLFIGYYIRRTKKPHQETETVVLFLLIICMYLVFFGQFFYWGMRFVLFLYPLIFILFSRILQEYISKLLSSIVIAVMCFVFSYSQFQMITSHSQSLTGEAIDIRFAAQQQFIKKVIKQLKTYDAYTPVYTDYQLAHYLWNPLFGYVASYGNNVYQIDDPQSHAECPTCKCDVCVYPDEIPRNKHVLIVSCDIQSDPSCQRFSDQMYGKLAVNGKLLTTVTPDWPDNSLGKYNIFEYYDPNP